MRIITRYIIKEHIGPFFFGLSAIAFIFILNVVFRELGRLLGKGLPVHVILEFFFLNIAWILALAIPMAVLIACLSTFGRFSSENEITALKASGMNMLSLMTPVLLIACLLALGMERFNNLVLPNFNYRAKILMHDIRKTRPTMTLESHVFFEEIPDYSILVHDVDDRSNHLEGIIINDSSDPKKNRTITADSGTLSFSEADDRMILVLYDGEIHETDRARLENYQRYIFTKQTFSFALEDRTLKRSTEGVRGDRDKTSQMMKDEIEVHRSRIRDRQGRIRNLMDREFRRLYPASWQPSPDSTAGHSSFSMIAGSRQPDSRTQRLLQQVRSELNIIDGYKRSIRALEVEVDKKVSIPVACIVFVLIGAPLGMMARHGGMTAWILSLIFFLIYWSCLIGGEQLADRGYIAPWIAMWIANILVGGFGVFLVLHSIRETTFIQWEQWWLKIKSLGRRHGHS
ncbi:LptF/LptG family permease [bacterium]|nr:LptF/LptG family permease [bacterium]